MDRKSTDFLRLILVTGVVIPVAGCMHAQMQESREFATAIAHNEAVVLLSKPHVEGTGTEEKFTDCVSADLQRGAKGKDGFKIHDDGQFVDALFPWFEPSTAP